MKKVWLFLCLAVSIVFAGDESEQKKSSKDSVTISSGYFEFWTTYP